MDMRYLAAGAAAQQAQIRHVSEALAMGICPNDETDYLKRGLYVTVWHVFVMVWRHLTYVPSFKQLHLKQEDRLVDIHRPEVGPTPSDATVALSARLWEIAKLLIQHGASLDAISIWWPKDAKVMPSEDDDYERDNVPHSNPSRELVSDLLKHLVPKSHLSELDEVIAARKNSHGPLPCACHEDHSEESDASMEG